MLKNRLCYLFIFCLSAFITANAIDNKGITYQQISPDRFTLVESKTPLPILLDKSDNIAINIAANNLSKDFERVCGTSANILYKPDGCKNIIIIGSINSNYISKLIKSKKVDLSSLKGKNEMYLMTTVKNPFEGVDEALVIARSDRRGTVYGIYELSEQIGVSPWYDWADVPVSKSNNLSIVRGKYTAGEPAVKYRGIFLNDEAPCLTGWVKNTYGTDFGDHRFYSRVFELLLRLRANFIWPAMWGWSFYADDPENSSTADNMGIIMGTSHHEPMARNHQEWARKRNEYGVWDYNTNQTTIDQFFKEGIERSITNEDLITIGMRGDGDTALGGKEGEDDKYVNHDEENLRLLEKIIKNQRKIIKDVTGKSPEKRQQVWALYKEVQRFYDMGLRVPDDVIILLSDDNWGNVRKLPNAKERKHPGGWGMYYHVDYVGAPRNTKWLNVTPIQNLWEQMQLTYSYGVDKLWVVNVGDLKPMEYPITLFLNMAWNPTKYNADNLKDHTVSFCNYIFGENNGKEAARILNLYSKYAGRVTPEMLDATTYNLETGEWKQVSDEFLKLETEALRQYISLPTEYKDAYKQIILFPVQALANLYEMYYAQAMNKKLYNEGNTQANFWADKVEETFARDKELCNDYNNVMSNGKWKGMMTQKHIGYRMWNDNFPRDIMPKVSRIEDIKSAQGGYVFDHSNGYVSIEAEHFFAKQTPEGMQWCVIPDMGRTLSGIALMPYIKPINENTNASLSYKMKLPADVKSVKVLIVVKSTLAFSDSKGHKYAVGFQGGNDTIVNFNHDLNEEPENVYSIFYPTVARRVIEKKVEFTLPESKDNMHTLVFRPLNPAIVLEKIVVDFGGYKDSYLFMNESPCSRK